MLYTETIEPTCRYHPETMLERAKLAFDPDGSPRGLSLPTHRWDQWMKRIAQDGGGLLIAAFICPRCGYAELFDVEPPASEIDNKQ